MLLFCPSCSNVLTVTSKPGSDSTTSQNRLECHTCPYEYTITKRIFERKTFPKKERDDIIGGEGQWEHAQKTAANCPSSSCTGDEAAFYQLQIRSADEPMSTFYRCMTCGNHWKEN